MARLSRPVTTMIWSMPAATASSTPYWMMGLSTMGSISLGCALVAGKKRVPNPAGGRGAVGNAQCSDQPPLQALAAPGGDRHPREAVVEVGDEGQRRRLGLSRTGAACLGEDHPVDRADQGVDVFRAWIHRRF